MPSGLGQIFIAVPEQLAEASRKVLIYFAQTLDIPEISEDLENELVEETTFTVEELEPLEPIDEGNFELIIPSTIDGIRVNINARSTEIEDIIDLKRIGPNRHIFYLARMIKGIYY